MKKIIFKSFDKRRMDVGKERITIQLRAYDKDGNYMDNDNSKNNQTIHIKDCDIYHAYEIVKSALMNSGHISKDFDIEE